ncbi:MAG: DUF3160 domain-containing protein [Leptolyngbya sp.]|nr:DUF3160 domain-containing protein [Candidatus Melainabacteria bacterium]
MALILLQQSLAPYSVLAQLNEPRMMMPIKLPSQGNNKPITITKDTSIEAVLKPQELKTTPVEPISLEGIKIPGTTPASIKLLSMNHFVVINNTQYESMADLYKDNRLKGKPNFVTLDAIVHPYFATTNGLIAAVVEEHAMPDLKLVLNAMLKATIEDYRATEDAEIKDDIQRNLAFFIVALRLLEPSIKLTDMGGATDLSDEEMKNIEGGHKTRSVIFDREEDFASMAPIGWFARREKLRQFYRCAQWISRMDFPLSDVTVDTATGSGNLFRRSILVFRSLDRATINGQPAINTWQKLVSAWELFATSSNKNRQKTLLYSDYKAVVQGNSQDLKAQLLSLASPFFRAKLLLTVRKQKPVGLGNTSIFDLADDSAAGSKPATFRLMPLIEDPEMPWLRARAGSYTSEENGGPWVPLSLLVMHARGSQAATNILYNASSTLPPEMNRLIPELERIVAKPKADDLKPDWERTWQILSGYFRPFGPDAQGALKTDNWTSRHLESAFAAWVDSHLGISEIKAINPDAPQKLVSPPTNAATPSTVTAQYGPGKTTEVSAAASKAAATSTATNAAPQATPPVRPATFHYLEPQPEVFRNIEADAKTLTDRLNTLGYFPERYRQRLNDFMRLGQRLAQIADGELAGKPTTPIDFKLLAGIDFILEQVAAPLPGVMSISVGSPPPKSPTDLKPITKGANLILGRPGLVLLLCQTTRGPMLVRGAVYTLYETIGPPLRPEHLKRKIEFGLLRPPIWAQNFDIVQDAAAESKEASDAMPQGRPTLRPQAKPKPAQPYPDTFTERIDPMNLPIPR